MTEKTRLEIEVKTCGHLKINVRREIGHPAVYINLGKDKRGEMDIGNVFCIKEEEAICELTKKPCMLYHKDKNHVARIDFTQVKRCPVYDLIIQKYTVEGKKRRKNFYAEKVNSF
jgi:hypothetical protein